MPAEEEEEDFSDYSIDDSGETEEEVDSAVDVLTTSVFMGRTKESIPAGSEISSLIGFHNVGDRPFIVKGVQASLRDANDFAFVLQNFTNLPVGSLIDGGEQASIMYKFLPENTLDPRDVTLELVVTYSDEDDDATQAKIDQEDQPQEIVQTNSQAKEKDQSNVIQKLSKHIGQIEGKVSEITQKYEELKKKTKTPAKQAIVQGKGAIKSKDKVEKYAQMLK